MRYRLSLLFLSFFETNQRPLYVFSVFLCGIDHYFWGVRRFFSHTFFLSLEPNSASYISFLFFLAIQTELPIVCDSFLHSFSHWKETASMICFSVFLRDQDRRDHHIWGIGKAFISSLQRNQTASLIYLFLSLLKSKRKRILFRRYWRGLRHWHDVS